MHMRMLLQYLRVQYSALGYFELHQSTGDVVTAVMIRFSPMACNMSSAG